MIELVVQLALSNLVISVALAALAYGVDRSGRYPAFAHVLWVLVLVKVLTPPLVMLPLIPGGTQVLLPAAPGLDPSGIDPEARVGSLLGQAMPVLLLVWGIGSAIVLAVSLVRVRRFDGLLRRTSRPAPAAIDDLAAAVSTQLGLRGRPDILVTSARLSPLTWWTGGRVRVVLPAALCKVIDADALRWVLAHELGHVMRRDHLVRWLEWLACVTFWWNPVVWWARHSLRHDEEVSCDALVVARLDGRPQAYARALLVVVEFLVGPATRPPAVATGMDGGGRLERRFARIVAQDPGPPMPRRLVASVMSAALVLMTIGVGSAALPSTMTAAPPSRSDPIDGTLDGFGRVPVSRTNEPSGVADDKEAYALLSAEVDAAELLAGPGARAKVVGVERAGTKGPDHIVGSVGEDVLRGRDGPDRLLGRPGADLLVGGRGRDELSGGPGADTIRGGPGHDLITGGDGPDTVHAGSGDDLIRTARDLTADRVDCGPGDADRAIVDAADSTTSCEVVIVR